MRTPMDVYRKLVEQMTAWVDWRIEVARLRFGSDVRTP